MKREYYSKNDLRKIIDAFDWSDYDYDPEECIVSAYSLLHGQCMDYACLLSGALNERGVECHVEGYRLNDITLAHAYCVVEHKDKKLYMDVRGVNDDYNDFMQEFVDFEKRCHKVDIDLNDKHCIDDKMVGKTYDTVNSFWENFWDLNSDCSSDVEVRHIMYLAEDIVKENIDFYIDNIDDWKYEIDHSKKIDSSKPIVDVNTIINQGLNVDENKLNFVEKSC